MIQQPTRIHKPRLFGRLELHQLASCPHCRCLVLAQRTGTGHTLLWDPDQRDRCCVVQLLHTEVWLELLDSQGFTGQAGRFHRCPHRLVTIEVEAEP